MERLETFLVELYLTLWVLVPAFWPLVWPAIPVLLAGVLVAVLWAMRRPWFCRCRKVKVYSTAIECYSQHLTDAWSVTHFGHGIVAYAAVRGVMLEHPASVAIVGAALWGAAWEVVENTPFIINAYRRRGDKEYCGDSIINAVGDYLLCVAGAGLTSLFV